MAYSSTTPSAFIELIARRVSAKATVIYREDEAGP